MKWFKHMSDMLDDLFITSVMDEFGICGYGVWCGVLEIYAKYCDGNNIGHEIEIPKTVFKKNLRISYEKLEKNLNFFSKKQKLFFKKTESGSYLVCIPKMHELRDKWTEVKGSKKANQLGSYYPVTTPKKKEERRKKEDLTIPTGSPHENAANPQKAEKQSEKEAKPHPIWDDALQILVQAGEKEPSARAFLGRALKVYGEGALNEAISACILEQPIEPKSFLVGILKSRKSENPLSRHGLDTTSPLKSNGCAKKSIRNNKPEDYGPTGLRSF